MITLKEFTLENARLVKEIATETGLPTDACVKIVDLSLAYDLARRSDEETHLTRLLERLIEEDAAADKESASA